MGFLELLKKIKTSQLTLGMHLHKFCAPWLRHPFLRSNFKLVLLKDIDKIQLANIDGSGYPKGLKGDQISTLTKIAAVCDVYDAITSDRPYKAGWKPAEAMKKMAQWEGHFDPRIFQLFVKVIGIYPIGSFVRLQSGKMGVVYQQNSQSLLNPQVNIFFCSKRKAQITLETIDLSNKEVIDKIISVENAKEWGIHDSNKYWAGSLL